MDIMNWIKDAIFLKRLFFSPINRSLFFDLSFKYSIDLYDLLDLRAELLFWNSRLGYAFFNIDGHLA